MDGCMKTLGKLDAGLLRAESSFPSAFSLPSAHKGPCKPGTGPMALSGCTALRTSFTTENRKLKGEYRSHTRRGSFDQKHIQTVRLSTV